MNTRTEKLLEEMVGSFRNIATHLKYLGNGDASTRMGAIEAHGNTILKLSESIETMGDSINSGLVEIAEAIRDSSENEIGHDL